MAGFGLNRRSWTDLSATCGFTVDGERRRKLPTSEPFDHGANAVSVFRKSDPALQVRGVKLTIPNRRRACQTHQLGLGTSCIRFGATDGSRRCWRSSNRCLPAAHEAES